MNLLNLRVKDSNFQSGIKWYMTTLNSLNMFENTFEILFNASDDVFQIADNAAAPQEIQEPHNSGIQDFSWGRHQDGSG